MCTVSVKVNEDVLRDYLPELENTAAIRKWAQMLSGDTNLSPVT